MAPKTLRQLGESLAIALIYLAVAKLGLRFATVTHSVTLVWPSSGVALAALLLLGRGRWPGVTLGAFVANAWTQGESLPMAAAIAVGNTLEAWLGAVLLERAGFQRKLDRIRDVLALLSLAGMLSTAASATVGVASLRLGGLISTQAIASTWRVWWLGDLMGDLIFAPAVLTLLAAVEAEWARRRGVEVLALVVALLAASLAAFGQSDRTRELQFLQPYAVFPLLVWASLRFGPPGAAGANVVVSVVSVLATVRGMGPFAGPTLNESLLQLQTFMATVVLTSLFLGAAVAERDRAIALRDDFLSLASHELNTPLFALQLDVNTLARLIDRTDVPQEKLKHCVSHTDRQIKRLGVLIRRMLDSSQVAAGRLTLHPTSVDLAALAHEVADRFTPELSQSGRSIAVQSSGPVVSLWDPIRLEVVLTNLVSNAVKYGRDKPIEVKVSASAAGAELQVRDFGIGIPLAEQPRVFGRFERAVSSREYPGLGLGLWISKSIVEAMQGKIEVSSEPGSGTTFTVTLPLVSPEAGPAAA